MHESIQKLTLHLKNVLSRSIDIARSHKSKHITPSIILLSLVIEKDCVANQILSQHELFEEDILRYINKSKKKRLTSEWPEFSTDSRKVIERAAVMAFEFEHQYIGTEHVLLALIDLADENVSSIFADIQVPLEQVKRELVNVMSGTSKFVSMQQLFGKHDDKGTVGHHSTQVIYEGDSEEESDTPALDFFAVELTAQEHLQKLDPVIGRQEEIERLVHIISRRHKNNPLLIGEAGVGKTAIVEGLAKKIAKGQVPEVLLDKRVFALDMSILLAGSMYRGEFESRLKQIVDEIAENPDIILFIDEIHNLVGAGGMNGGGSMDAANMLKPALARGEIRCIGATTPDEFRMSIEKDPALARRFQPIMVEEPSVQNAVKIVKGIAPFYEQHHNVRFTPEALQAAVEWSNRYITDKHLPDKAIDLIDEAGAKVYAGRTIPLSAKEVKRAQMALQKVTEAKSDAVRQEQFSAAGKLQKEEKAARSLLKKAEAALKKDTPKPTEITVEDIAHILSKKTEIPLEQIMRPKEEYVEQLMTGLKKHIVGQEHAIEKISNVMKRSFAGIAPENRPLGSFLFLGPSGVGKTETAKAIAESVFGSEDALIRLDMSEYADSFTTSKLMGAPAGYIGYNDRVSFVEQIRKRPYSVVLFDELEKAHPNMYNVLLQILDEGRLTDGTGRELNFKNTVIIMTSNVGLDLLTKQAELGFDTAGKKGDSDKQEHPLSYEEIEEAIMSELPMYFLQEFLNRIDHKIVFKPLTLQEVKKIVHKEFSRLRNSLKKRGIRVHMNGAAKTFVAKDSFSAEQGARLVRKTLADGVETLLANAVLTKTIEEGDVLKITVQKQDKEEVLSVDRELRSSEKKKK